MKQYNYIYKITNLVNCKIYIGKHSTDNLDDSYMGSGTLIKNAKSKYGIHSFKKEIIAFTDNEESLNFLERFYIKKYKSQDLSIGYNLASGGEGIMLGKHHSDEARIKMSKAKLRGKHRSEETRAKMSAAAKGRTPWNKGKTNKNKL